MPPVTIETLEKQYGVFAEATKEMIKKFHNRGYDTFVSDCKEEEWFKRDFIQNSLDQISLAYAFVKLLKDIYSHEFIQGVLAFAESKGFRPRHVMTQRSEPDWTLAWNLATHYALWGWKTYDNLDFIGIGFSREEPKPGYAMFAFVAFVPILDIKLDKNGIPLIKAYDWKIIDLCLKSMEKSE